MKKKSYEEIAKLLKTDLPKPTEDQIEETIRLIEKRLEEKGINMAKNHAVKEGYTKAIEVLKTKKLNYDGLTTVQGRAIAAISYDYLNGECTQELLTRVPLKSQF
jgi:phosphopantetheinyl transferase (holo-ACP synthase)